jgi:hypothetical protein
MSSQAAYMVAKDIFGLESNDDQRFHQVAEIIDKHFKSLFDKLNQTEKDMLSMSSTLMKFKKEYDHAHSRIIELENQITIQHADMDFLASYVKTIDGELTLPSGEQVATEHARVPVSRFQSELISLFQTIEKWCKKQQYHFSLETKIIEEPGVRKYKAPLAMIRATDGNFVVETISLNSNQTVGRVDLYSWPPVELTFQIIDFHKGWALYNPLSGEYLPWDKANFLSCMDALASYEESPKSENESAKSRLNDMFFLLQDIVTNNNQ